MLTRNAKFRFFLTVILRSCLQTMHLSTNTKAYESCTFGDLYISLFTFLGVQIEVFLRNEVPDVNLEDHPSKTNPLDNTRYKL